MEHYQTSTINKSSAADTETTMYTHSERSFHPFLRLPPELRNQIYSYIFGGLRFHTDGFLPIITKIESTSTSKELESVGEFSFALSQTSRQLHAETRSLPFRLNTFTLPTSGTSSNYDFKLDDDRRNAIGSVKICFHDNNQHEIVAWPRPKDIVFPEGRPGDVGLLREFLEWRLRNMAGVGRVMLEDRTSRRILSRLAKKSVMHCADRKLLILIDVVDENDA